MKYTVLANDQVIGKSNTKAQAQQILKDHALYMLNGAVPRFDKRYDSVKNILTGYEIVLSTRS